MSLIWATRGRSWGFRFLRDGEFLDPLPLYDDVFTGTEGESIVCRRVGTWVALRFPDPDGRSDESGRVIPHEFVVPSPLADNIRSVEDGQRIVWPLIADAFDDLWELAQAPTAADVRSAFDKDLADITKDDRR
ncbi:hypothetical protein [Promicromonospora sukumoe]